MISAAKSTKKGETARTADYGALEQLFGTASVTGLLQDHQRQTAQAEIERRVLLNLKADF